MGMLTTDEAQDAGPRHVESTVVDKGVQGLKDRLQERDAAEQDTTEPVKGEEVDADTAAEAERQKAALAAGEFTEETEDTEEAPDEPGLSGDTASIFD